MNSRTLSDPQYAFKAAVRRSVKVVGGPNAAAAVVRVDAPRLSRYGNNEAPEFAPIDVCFELDKAAVEASEDPAILRAWADLMGFDLVPRNIATEVEEDVVLHAGNIAKESGELISQAIEAVADGKLSPREAMELDTDAADLQDRIVQLRSAVRPALRTR